MYQELREEKPHGTREYPFVYYHLHRITHSFQIPVHWHNELEIIYIRKGHLQVSISGERYIAGDGQVFLVNPGELHYMGTSEIGVDYYTFLFPLEFISFQLSDELENHVLLPLRSGRMQFVNHMDTEFQEKATGFCETLSQQTFDASGSQLRIRILLLELVNLWLEYDLVHRNSRGTNSSDKDLLIYLQQNYASNLTLQDLSRHFHLSEKYLSRYFSERFGLPLSQYIKHLRLSHARHLLITTELSVTEIALQSGFPNVSHFIRTFRKSYLVSPLQYRKQESRH